MGALRRDIDAVLAAIAPAGEPLVVSDYGAVRGSDAGLGRAQLFSRAIATARELVVVALTIRTWIRVPVHRGSGVVARACHGRLVPRLEDAELVPRDQIIVERGHLDHGVLPLRFVRRDGSACLVEVEDDPRAWIALPV